MPPVRKSGCIIAPTFFSSLLSGFPVLCFQCFNIYNQLIHIFLLSFLLVCSERVNACLDLSSRFEIKNGPFLLSPESTACLRQCSRDPRTFIAVLRFSKTDSQYFCAYGKLYPSECGFTSGFCLLHTSAHSLSFFKQTCCGR